MIHRCLWILTVALVSCGMANAADAPPLVHTGVVEASLDNVWAAFTTTAGIKSWMVPHADIELKVGGKMRTHYDKNGTLGDENSIENTILSFDPKRMLSIKATKAPKNFPFKKSIEGMWTVIYFEAMGAKQTKLTIVGLGFCDDEESQKLRRHFDAGNAYTLKKLQKRFAAK